MAEDGVERQLTFAELDSNVTVKERENVSNVSKESKKVGVIPIDKGAGMYTGAYGDSRTYMYTVPEGATGRIIQTKRFDNVTSAKIEFESPPELQGQTFWVERRRKGPGFV